MSGADRQQNIGIILLWLLKKTQNDEHEIDTVDFATRKKICTIFNPSTNATNSLRKFFTQRLKCNNFFTICWLRSKCKRQNQNRHNIHCY